MRPNPMRWTEDELKREIERLDTLIAESGDHEDRRSRCATAYLRQVVRDRRDALATLRHGRTH